MLIDMRKPVAKVVTFVLFSLLILSFAVWGIGDIFRSGGQGTAVAEVGSVKIESEEYNRALRQEMARLQQSFGGQVTMEQLRAFGVTEQVLQRLVGRALFDQSARDLKLTVTDAQVKRSIAEEPAFKNQLGDFDPARFNQAIRSLGLSEQGYVFTLKRDIERQQIGDAVTAGLTDAPKTLTEVLFDYSQELRTAEGLLIEREAVADIPEPDEAALTKLYEERASQFMIPETKKVSLLFLRASDLAKEIAVGEEELAAAYETRKDEFRVPERRDLEQILLPSEEAAKAAKEEVGGGKDFAAVAQEKTQGDPIQLGSLSREDLEQQFPELAPAAFDSGEGQVSDPVQTAFGWHLIRVKSIEPGKEPSLEEVSDELRQDIALERALDQMVEQANEIDDALAGGETLEEAANKLGVDLMEIPAIDDQGRDRDGKTVEGLPDPAVFLQVLADAKPGEPSLLTETDAGNYFLLRVNSVSAPEQKPQEAVHDELVQLWKSEEQNRLAKERAESLMARAAEGVTLAKIAEDEGLTLVIRGPVNRFGQGRQITVSGDLAAKLFEMQKDELGQAETEQGIMVMRLLDIDRPDPAAEPEALKALADQVASSLRNDILAGFANALRVDTDVTVNRRVLEELASRY